MTAPLNDDDQLVVDILHRAVRKALDRKRRLGQYAVFWRDGKVVKVPPEELPTYPPELENQSGAQDEGPETNS